MISISDPPLKTRQLLKVTPTFEKARKQLEALSNRELLSNLQKLNQKERRLKVLVLLYLSEIDKRELYVPLGFSSLFDFCTLHLGYTRATAARRIRSARTVAKYPEALNLFLSGEINITTLALVSVILDRDNYNNILSEIRGKSTRYVELLVSRHKPLNIIRDTVRPVCVMRRVKQSPEISDADPAAERSSLSAETNSDRPDSTPSAETNTGGRLPGRVILEQRLKLGFTVTPEFMKKYNKIKSLLSNTYPEGIDFETLFETTMNEYLEKHDPEKRRKRRIKKAARPDNTENSKKGRGRKTRCKAQKVNPGQGNSRKKDQHPAPKSRDIPPAVRDQVYARDKGKCTFVGANGKRCNSTWDLEIDHVVPYARGGNNSPGNLRLLCRKHNIYRAEKAYSKEFMKNRITGK
jgi:5-methylcytosine-specific restriction endonuclease McrA